MTAQLPDQRNHFYNYVYCDPRKPTPFKVKGIDLILPGEPFYVGKGRGYRKDSHLWDCSLGKGGNNHKDRKINKIKSIGRAPIIVQINNGLPEYIAIQNEIYLIKTIGRNDLGNGPLTNLTDGGDGLAGRISVKKEIGVYNPKTKEIVFYKSIDDYVGVNNSGKYSKIGASCRDEVAQYKGLIIFYKKNYTEKYLDDRIVQFEKWKIEYASRYKRRCKSLIYPIEKPIVVYDFLTNSIAKYSSTKEYVGNKYPKEVSSIRACCGGVRKHFKGKIFFYQNEFTEEVLNNRKSLLLNSNLTENTKKLIGLI